MVEALDLAFGRALGPYREDLLNVTGTDLAAWVGKTLLHEPRNPSLFARALTHASFGDGHYERLEFLGDRVLGLAIASWLYELFPGEPEGSLSRRLNVLVSGETCAGIARELGVSAHLKLGKQARDDGAFDSDNVLGDVIEALIGALYLEAGLEAATAFIRHAWRDRVDKLAAAPKHPKAVLQEWAAANNRKAPAYRVVETSGPDHAPRFTIEVEAGGAKASGTGLSKQDAETEAARAMIEKLL